MTVAVAVTLWPNDAGLGGENVRVRVVVRSTVTVIAEEVDWVTPRLPV